MVVSRSDNQWRVLEQHQLVFATVEMGGKHGQAAHLQGQLVLLWAEAESNVVEAPERSISGCPILPQWIGNNVGVANAA